MSRYIDADALLERFAEMQKVKPDKDGREYACNFRNMGGEPSAEWFAVEDAVENAPTVDAVPVDFINQKIVELQSCAYQHFNDGHKMLATCVCETIRLLGSFLKEWRGKEQADDKR